MSDPLEVAASNWDVMIAEEIENIRTVTPVHITSFDAVAAATCECEAAVPDLLPDGSPGKPSLLSERPVWYPGGGGFFIRYPLETDDIALGLVSDRSLAAWSTVREASPTACAPIPHYHNLSDTQVVALTDQPGIAENDPGISSDLVIAGPGGVAIRIEPDSTLTLTTSAATLTVNPDGTIEVGGTSVLVKNDALVSALDVFIAALVAAGSGPTYAGAGAAQTAWNGVKNTFATTFTKGG